MGAMNWERWARAAGAGFVALAVAAFIVGGEAPKVGDSTDDLISYYDGDRGKVLVSSLLFAFALALFLWFAAAIANLLRESGEGRVAATVIAGATAFVIRHLAGVARDLDGRAETRASGAADVLLFPEPLERVVPLHG
jgi:hypothetical protein